MDFNEDAFRAKATEQGISAVDQDAYLATKVTAPVENATTEVAAPTSTPSSITVPQEGFDEIAFRAKATDQGITQEQQDAYIANKAQLIVTDPDFFAKPSTTNPLAVQKSYRKFSTDIDGNFNDPIKMRNMPGSFGIPGITPTDEEYEKRIRNYLEPKEVLRIAKDIKANPGSQDGIDAIYSHALREENWRQDSKELLANLQELNSVERPFKWIKSNFDNAADAEWRSIQAQNIENIAALAEERGIQLVHQEGEFFAYDNAGNLHRVTPGFLQSIGKSKYEVAGGIAGAIAGSKVPVKHPYAKLGAIALGGIIGVVAGEEIDYLSSAIAAQEELSANVALEKAIGAAQMGAVFEVAGGATAKLIQGSWKSLRHAYNAVRNNNTAGAYAALKDTLGYLDDDQVEELVTRWEKLNQTSAPGKTAQEKALATLPTTTPGGEAIVAAAARNDNRAALTVRADLNARAKTVLQAAKNPTDDTGIQLRSALKDYSDNVKASYGVVKASGAELVPAEYKFSLTNKSVRPLLEETIDEIADPAVVEKLQRVLVKIDQKSTSRTFNDLLDLRELLNEFKYANKVTSKSKFVADQGIKEARAEVDSEIARVMQATPEGKQWLKDWKDVNQAYGEFKMVQKNALFKAVTKPGVAPKDVARALVKHGPDLDDTYADVVAKIPVKTKALVENEIIEQLSKKHSSGSGEGFKAVHFTELAEELKYYNFSSAKAQKLKRAVDELSNVYRNDRELFKVNPNLREASTDGIATTIRGKMKMAFVNNVWRFMNRAKPGPQADVSALVSKAAKFLEDPLDSTVANKVLKDIGDDVELAAAMKRLQAETAKEISEGNVPVRLKVFTDKRNQKFYKSGPGRRPVAGREVPMHRVAKAEEISALLGRDITNAAPLTKTEKIILADKGFLAIGLDNGRLIDLR